MIAGRKVAVGFWLGLAILALIGWLDHRSVTKLIEAASQVATTHRVAENLQTVRLLLDDAETGERGYIITGDEEYLAPYDAATSAMDHSVKDLRTLTAADPKQRRRLDALEPLLRARLNALKEKIDVRRAQGLAAGVEAVRAGPERKIMADIQTLITEMKDEETERLRRGDEESRADAQKTLLTGVVGGLLSFALLLSAFHLLNREITERKRLHDRLDAERGCLAAALQQMPAGVLLVEAPSGKIILGNEQGGRVTSRSGPAPRIVEHYTQYTVFHSDGRPYSREERPLTRSMSTGEVVTDEEMLCMRADGTRLTVRCSSGPIRNSEGRITAAVLTFYDITDRKRVEEALRESEERFRQMAESIEEVFWLKDLRANRVIYVSPAYEKAWGRSRQTLYAAPQSWAEVIHSDDRDRVLEAVRTKQVSGDYDELYRISPFDGSIRWIRDRAFPIRDASGEVYRIAGIADDVTDLKQAEEALRTTTAELQATNEELQAFSYSVSHDLHAPLRAIEGFSRALLEDYADKFDERGKDYLKRVGAATERMAQLINDLLALSGVTSSELKYEPVNLSAIAHEIVADLRRSQPDRQVTFIIADGLIASGDPRLLRVAIENLLGNAWKFTTKHRAARIEFGVSRNGGEPVYFVRDDGAGFDMAYADKLFGAFQRLHSMAEFRGTGIGLATVQRVVHRHGGRIWAEGAVERGATFYFTLVQQAERQPPLQRRRQPAGTWDQVGSRAA